MVKYPFLLLKAKLGMNILVNQHFCLVTFSFGFVLNLKKFHLFGTFKF